MSTWRTLLAAALLSATAGAAGAQTATSPRDPNMPSPQNVPAEKIRPEGSEPKSTGSTGGTLSERLDRSDGVLTPPATGDNAIVTPAPVPNPGTTPVIRPPATGGITPEVQTPK